MRAGVSRGEIEDVWLRLREPGRRGQPQRRAHGGAARGAAGHGAGVTVNRLCGSGLAAVVGACHAVIAGEGDLFVAGGVESMSRAPFVTAKPTKPFARGDRTLYDTTLGWRFVNPSSRSCSRSESMGETGENVAEQWGVTREEQDAFALASQRRWAAARRGGPFRRRDRPGRRRRRATSIRGPTRRREARVAEAGVPRGRNGDRRQLLAASTTEPPRS